MSKTEILQQLTSFQQNDLNTKGGKVWAYVYDSGLVELDTIAMEAYKMFANHNGLDFSVFPSLLKMENDIVAETASLFSDGYETLAGTFTSGGTESIILAVKAARDYARVHKPSIKNPEIILPETAHAAFHKAAHYLDIKMVIVPIGEGFKVDVEAVKSHITENTIMLVGSSVNYSHGVSDPIEALNEIALKHDVWLHIDGCIGGFLMAYFRELGHEVPKFDFSLPGVSSLSVDLHKYAFAPKGASVILYRNKDLRKYQFYTCTNWTGYPVINTTIQSTKSGGPLAACWATLHYIGKQGYRDIFEKMYQTKNKMLQKFEEMDDIYVLGKPEASLISFASKTIDIFQLADLMRKKGWYIQVQPGNEKLEPTIHLTLTPVSENIADNFFEQLNIAINEAKENPRTSLVNKIEPLLAGLKEGEFSVNPETIQSLLQMVGISETGMLPDEMADINELLHLLPSEISSEAFLYITNELFTIESA
ncbi:MAG: aspartate aminotransferase family protein [Balneolaceae bacterium]